MSQYEFEQPIDNQLGQLLAFIVLFEKKIQELRIKLAGNEEFHSRLAFQLFDVKRKCIITPQAFVQGLYRHSSTISIGQAEAFCRKYTANGAFSYDQFIKFLTPKTNKILAQRLLIRTYRAGAEIPPYVIKILFQLISNGINMITITQNLRKKIQQSNQLTHIELLEFFKKCCTTKSKLFYFINASTQGQGDYDFQLDQMNYLCFHIKGKCDLEDILDHQIKQLLCPLDMNFQKTFANTFYNKDVKSRTDYFNGKTLNQQTNQNKDLNTKTVNFLKTNYKQTSKNFYKPGLQDRLGTRQSSKQIFDPVDQNVQTRLPTPMNYRGQFPNSPKDQQPGLFGFLQNLAPKSTNLNSYQDSSQNYQSINYNNMYIEKFARQQVPTNDSRTGLNNIAELNNYLKNNKMNQNSPYRGKQQFQDDFYQNNDEYSDQMSRGSAFVQY